MLQRDQEPENKEISNLASRKWKQNQWYHPSPHCTLQLWALTHPVSSSSSSVTITVLHLPFIGPYSWITHRQACLPCSARSLTHRPSIFIGWLLFCLLRIEWQINPESWVCLQLSLAWEVPRMWGAPAFMKQEKGIADASEWKSEDWRAILEWHWPVVDSISFSWYQFP